MKLLNVMITALAALTMCAFSARECEYDVLTPNGKRVDTVRKQMYRCKSSVVGEYFYKCKKNCEDRR